LATPTPKPTVFTRFRSINTLLIFIPLALLGRVLHWSDMLVFVCSGLAIIPLSKLIGDATEEIAHKLGPKIGGLVNATLGNSAELIITLFALSAGLVDLVKASIVGSILGNLLLVLGASLLVGGLKHGTQVFERRSASMNSTLVLLAFLVLALPSGFDQAFLSVPDGAEARETFFSEGIAGIMIVLYGLTMLYTLRAPKAEHTLNEAGVEAAELHHPEVNVNMRRALIMLGLSTLGIVLMSETLVATVEPVAISLGLSHFFIGIIVVPIIGNVAEHVVAIEVAADNRMDLSLGISLGSSLQIALFVAPVLVFASLLFPKKLLLIFTPYELMALAAASIVAALVSLDGESNWLEGVLLIAVYAILALAFFLIPSAVTTIPVHP
jgi:Ca2+:H+ antiporter